MNTTKRTAQKQLSRKIDAAAKLTAQIQRPQIGWLSQFRQALGMSVTELAKRSGLSQPTVTAAQQSEAEGRITLQQLEKLADAMDAKLVYAIVPKQGTVSDLVMAQAYKKAKRIIKRSRAHMALEAQTEGLPTEEEQIEELAADMAREMKRGFWS